MPGEKTKKSVKSKVQRAKKKAPRTGGLKLTATVLSSETVFQCALFRVQHDKIIEPGGRRNERDVIRHNGSVVILAVDNSQEQEEPVDRDGAAVPSCGQPVPVGTACGQD